MSSEARPATLPFAILALLGMLVAIGPLAIDMYLPALPMIAADIKVPINQVQHTLAIFMVGFSVSQLIYGPLSDRFGRKPIIIGGVILYTFVSLLFTVVDSIEWMIIMRLLQALGGGAAAVVVMAIVRDQFSGREAAKVLSAVMTVMVITPLFAPLLGGWFLLIWSWHSIFWFMGIFGLVVTLWALVKLEETHPHHLRQDLSVKQMVANTKSIFGHKEAMGYILTSSLAFGVMFAFIAGSPFVYIEYFGVSADHYGLLFACNVVMMLFLNWVNGRIVVSLGMDKIIVIALKIQLTATSLLLLATMTHIGGLWVIVPLIMLSIGVVGLLAANTMAAAITPFKAYSGYASALFGTIRFLLASLAIAAVSWLHNETPLPMVSVMFCCSVLAMIIFSLRVKSDK